MKKSELETARNLVLELLDTVAALGVMDSHCDAIHEQIRLVDDEMAESLDAFLLMLGLTFDELMGD